MDLYLSHVQIDQLQHYANLTIFFVTEFIKENPQYLAKPNQMEWLSHDGGETYDRCHFWSNFEVT